MSRNFASFDKVLESKPGNWKVERLGNLFAQRKEKNRPDLPLLAVTGTGGVVPRDSLVRRDTSNADKSKYLRVCEGDIAYNTMRMWQGVSGLSSYEGIVSPAYTICRPKDGVSSTYMAQLFKLSELIQVFHRNSQGLVDDTLNLKFENFSPIQVPVPPLPEQQKIAAILSSVDDVIEKTRAQIDKLKDLKTGMMQELLTKGMGHTEFKDSSVGLIPASWNVVSLQSLIENIYSGWSPVCEARPRLGDEWGILKTTAVVWSGYSPTENKVLAAQYQPVENAIVKKGDILITRKGPRDRVGVCVYVMHTPKNLMVPDTVLRVVLNKDDERVSREYVATALSSDFIQTEWDKKKVGLAEAQVNVNHQILNATRIALPPLSEQIEICKFISTLQGKISVKERKFNSLKQVKKALMQDLLTGKVRVKVDQKESAVA